jgi:hypothetical protein
MNRLLPSALLMLLAFSAYSQNVESQASPTPPLTKSVDQVIERSEDHFRKGKSNLVDNKLQQARDEFDKALDEILISGLDVSSNWRLHTFYLALVEKIYREEAPLRQPRGQIGFRQQGFDPSPLDPLSKLVLTEDEKKVPGGSRSKQLEDALLGSKPIQLTNGSVPIVMKWFQENLHDPYSMRIVRWSKVERRTFPDEPYWVVRVRLRTKNAFGAYILNDYTFVIRRNRIERSVN